MNSTDPVDVVQAQLEAYNARNLERFLATYSESIVVYRPPALEPALSGKAELARFYAQERFNLPGLKADIVNRTVLGNKVIDHELVWGVRGEAFEVAAVYEVRDGLIERVWHFVAI
jgi:hypothetical protein